MTISRLFVDNGGFDFFGLTSKEIKPDLLRLGYFDVKKSGRNPTNSLILAWGSRDPAGIPNGLLVAEAKEQGDKKNAKDIEILSLYVKRNHRRQGIAGSLINTMIRDCSRWAGSSISLIYPLETESTPFLETLTSEAKGWEPSKTRLCSTTIEAYDAAQDFVERCNKIGKYQIIKHALTIAPITGDSLKKIQTIAEEKELASWTCPSSAQQEILLERSRVLEIKDDVIGWLLCTGKIGDHLFYRAGWVFDDWQSRGCLPAMIASVAKDAHFGEAHPMVEEGRMTPFPKVFFEFEMNNEPMKHFSKRNLLPIASSIIYTKQRSINL